MTEKGCDNCYYTYFDERAYPCSLCIRGVERTDQWQPSRKTKADRKTEPFDKDINVRSKTEPQTDCGDFADRLAYERGVKHAWEVAQKVFDSTVTFYEAEDVAKQITRDEPQTDLLVTEYPQDGEVNLIGRDKTEAAVMAYDVYKELTEPQTDCSWQKGE